MNRRTLVNAIGLGAVAALWKGKDALADDTYDTRRVDTVGGRPPPATSGDPGLRNQLLLTQQRLASLEAMCANHGIFIPGTDSHEPHRDIAVETLVFGNGLGRLDQNGISLQATDNGVAGLAFLPSPLARDSSAISVNDTTDETSLFKFTVPGGTITGTRAIRLTIGGSSDAETVANNATIRLKFGGTTVSSRLRTFLNDDGWYGVVYISLNSTWNMVAFGILTTEGGLTQWGNGGFTEDEADDLDIEVTVEWASALSTSTFTKNYALLERV